MKDPRSAQPFHPDAVEGRKKKIINSLNLELAAPSFGLKLY